MLGEIYAFVKGKGKGKPTWGKWGGNPNQNTGGKNTGGKNGGKNTKGKSGATGGKGGESKGKGGKTNPNIVCWNCGGVGHPRSQCPNSVNAMSEEWPEAPEEENPTYEDPEIEYEGEGIKMAMLTLDEDRPNPEPAWEVAESKAKKKKEMAPIRVPCHLREAVLQAQDRQGDQ